MSASAYEKITEKSSQAGGQLQANEFVSKAFEPYFVEGLRYVPQYHVASATPGLNKSYTLVGQRNCVFSPLVFPEAVLSVVVYVVVF